MVAFLALLAYRGQITRYEEDQLFLNDNNTQEQKEQNEIVRKVDRLRPIVRAVGGVTGLMTAAVVGTWCYGLWQQFLR
jgi:hypothetical protein